MEGYTKVIDELQDTIIKISGQVRRIADEDRYLESPLEPELIEALVQLSEEFRQYFSPVKRVSEKKGK